MRSADEDLDCEPSGPTTRSISVCVCGSACVFGLCTRSRSMVRSSLVAAPYSEGGCRSTRKFSGRAAAFQQPPARQTRKVSTKPYYENGRSLPTQGGEVGRAVQLVASSLRGLLLRRLGAGGPSRRGLAVVTVGVCFLLQHFGLRRQQPVSFLSIAALLALDPTVCLLLQHYGKFLTAAKSAQLLRQQLLRSRSWAETL